MDEGIYQMPAEAYHKVDALSSSRLRKWETPKHCKAYIDNPPAPTPAMVFGTMGHAALLEPEIFKAQYYILSSGRDRRTKAVKEEIAQAQQDGKAIISSDDYEALRTIKANLYSDPLGRAILKEDNAYEQSFFWKHPKYGYLCKCRPDIRMFKPKRIIYDLKFTTDISEEGFAKTIANQKLHWQAHHYLLGANHLLDEVYDKWVWVAIESKPPYDWAPYPAHADDLYLAKEQLEPIYARYGECLASGVWPGYEKVMKTIRLPRWAVKL